MSSEMHKIKLDAVPEDFDPQKASTYKPVTVVAVDKPAMVRVEPCNCGEHRDRYYVYGIEGHYVKSEDYDALLMLYADAQRALDEERLRTKNLIETLKEIRKFGDSRIEGLIDAALSDTEG